MTKLKAQYLDLQKCLKKIKEILAEPETEANRDASIKRFEFTFEMAWKLMQSIAKENNIDVYGIKTVIREGAKLGLIDNPQDWFQFLKNRNYTTHIYKEYMAKKVYQAIKKFPALVEQLLSTAKDHLDS